MKSYKNCALHYFFQWISRDREFVGRFKEHISTEDVDKLFRFYGVSRNFPDKKKQRKERYRGLARILSRLKSERITEDNASRAVENCLQQTSKVYGEKTVSAVSKAIWMVKRSPIAIYDSRALKALKGTKSGRNLKSGDYKDYYDVWRELFARERQRIRRGAASVVRTLEKVLLPETIKLLGGKKGIRSICSSAWFHERVFDMRLFFGAAKE